MTDARSITRAFVPLHEGYTLLCLLDIDSTRQAARSLPFALPLTLPHHDGPLETAGRRTNARTCPLWSRSSGEILCILGEKDGIEAEEEKKKKRKREKACWWCVVYPPFAVCHLRTEFSRATLPRVSYYLTLPYGFEPWILFREFHQSDVSSSFESHQCGVYRRKPLLISLCHPLVFDGARTSRAAKFFPSFSPTNTRAHPFLSLFLVRFRV